MTELVLNISRFGFQSLGIRASETIKKVSNPSSSIAEIIFLGITLAALQLLDGILTGVGVSHYGVNIEANIFIRSLMTQWGYITALFAIKISSILIIAALCRLALTVNWVTSALKGVIVLYLTAAIIPWTAILVLHVWQ